MARRSWPTYLLVSWLLAWWAPVIMADDAQGGSGQTCEVRIQLPEKPELPDYADYNTFLVDVMQHKHQVEQRRQHQQRCPELYRPAPIISEPPEAEDLDEAVAENNRAGRESTRLSETRHSPGLEEEAPEQLSEQYLAASLETLTQDMEPEQARLMLLRIAETMADPNKDLTREELRRIYEDAVGKREFLFPIALENPEGLAGILGDGNLRLFIRNDGKERIVAVIHSCLGSLCDGTHLVYAE